MCAAGALENRNASQIMLSYQHIYHAGNLADIHKHAILCSMLSYLGQKDKAFCYIETHGGRALYDLKSKEALKTGEASAGIERLLRDGKISTDMHSPYGEALAALRMQYGQGTYPGSPLFAAHFLRPQDRAYIAELHPQETIHLSALFEKTPQKIQIRHEDGLKMAGALIPPTPRRGILMIDPSYEIKGEYEKIASFITKMHKKWPVGVIALWYPILPSGQHVAMTATLKAQHPDALCHEVNFKAIKDHRLQGSGMFIINPPYQTQEHCRAIEALFI